jgi:hypothetical protein
MGDIVIIDAVRTPIGRAKVGLLSSWVSGRQKGTCNDS